MLTNQDGEVTRLEAMCRTDVQPHSRCADQNDQDDGRWLEARVRVRGQAPRDEAERGVPTASRLFLVGATESQS